MRPDRRAVVLFRGPVADQLDATLAEHPGELYAMVDEDDEVTLADFGARGFVVHRREHNYVVPTAPGFDPSLPPGYRLVRTTDADPDHWRLLDDELRQDVPGADGWRNDPARFAADQLADPEFDPALYLIAVAEAGDYAGLVRVWLRGSGPRLGLIGVTRAHRRHGLARALLGHVFTLLRERGLTSVECEIDEQNAASTDLFATAGAKRVGSTLELRRPAEHRPTDS